MTDLFSDADPASDMAQLNSVDPSAFPDAPAQRHSPTSVDAADQIKGVSGKMRRIVLDVIRGFASVGCSDEEGMLNCAMPASTWRPRRVELVNAGLVVDSGKTRKTKSGRKAVVWISSGFRQ